MHHFPSPVHTGIFCRFLHKIRLEGVDGHYGLSLHVRVAFCNLVHEIPVLLRENRAARGSLEGELHELECQRSRIGDCQWCVGLMNVVLIQSKVILSFSAAYLSATPLSIFIAFTAAS